jgi:LacI family gluconate utilization system Gnt-I transcriptional repressor
MDDIAAEAGVSQMTVSRVMRGTGQTTTEVRDRVLNAARRLGYVQNRLATALRGESSSLVALVLPTLRNRVFSEVLNGANEVLAAGGLRPVFGVTEYSAAREEELVRDLLSWRPKGLILSGLEHSDATRAAIRASGVRVAELMDIDGDPISVAFGLSQTEAGRATARHMLAKGYRRFGYIGSLGGKDLRAEKRLAGFREVLREAGAQILSERLIHGPSSMVEGRRETAAMSAAADAPEAIYYSNDDLAAGGIMHCLSEGLSIPTQLALAGFNGLSFLDALPLRLTTVETPRLEMGRRAAAHIMRQPGPEDVVSDPGPTAGLVDLGFRLIPGETC